jgi:hypothetical protein
VLRPRPSRPDILPPPRPFRKIHVAVGGRERRDEAGPI